MMNAKDFVMDTSRKQKETLIIFHLNQFVQILLFQQNACSQRQAVFTGYYRAAMKWPYLYSKRGCSVYHFRDMHIFFLEED